MTKQPRPCREDEFFAHPDDPVDRMGKLFVAMKIRERYGINFDRYVELVQSGVWKEYVA